MRDLKKIRELPKYAKFLGMYTPPVVSEGRIVNNALF